MKLDKLKKAIALCTLTLAGATQATEYEYLREFQVSESTDSACNECGFNSTALENGELLSTWQTIEAGSNKLHFQVFTNDDLTNSVSSSANNIDFGSIEISSPISIAEGAGEFSLFWVEDGTAIAAQGYSDANTADAPAAVIASTASPINGLDVALFEDGTRMIIWSTTISVEERQIFGLRLDSDNLPLGQVTELSKSTLLGSGMIKIFPLPQNNYYLASETADENSNILIAMDLFDANDEVVKSETAEVIVNGDDNIQVNGAVLGDKSVMLTWLSSSLTESQIMGQRFDANGLEENAAVVLLPATEENISRPALHPLMDGNYVLTWRQDNDLHGQRFSFANDTIGDVITFNNDPLVSAPHSTGLSFQSDISIAAVSTTEFAASFREGSASGSEYLTKVYQHNRAAHAAPGEPTADAGPDVLYHGRDTHYLSSANSKDAFGYTRLRYQWDLISKPADSNVNLSTTFASPSFYPDKLGEYKIQLTVRNRADGITNTDTITFYNYNNAPVADAGEDITATMIGSAVQLSSTGSYDIDNDYLWYSWEIVQMPAGSAAALDNTSSPTPRFVPDQRGTYHVQLTVRDAWADSEPDTIIVGFDNTAPEAHVLAPQSALINQLITLDGSNSHDVNQDSITYSWNVTQQPAGSNLDVSAEASDTLNFTPTTAGLYQLTLTVNDGLVDSAPFQVNINVEDPEPEVINEAPIANAGEDFTHELVGWVVQLDGRNSTDPNGDSLTYQWQVVTKPSSSEASLDNPTSPTARLIADGFGYYHVQLVVSDGELTSAYDEVIVHIPNTAPRSDAGLDRTVNPGDFIQLDGSSSTDPNGEEITYAWELIQIPNWSMTTLSNTTSAGASFTADVPGDYHVKLTVTDESGMSGEDIVIITATNQAPTANAGLDQTMQSMLANVQLDGSLSSDPEGLPLSYSWEFVSLPVGATSVLNNANTANASFAPSIHGTYQVALIVNDGIADSVVDTVVITVLNQAPTANAGADMNINGLGSQIQLDGSLSSDADGQALTFVWVMTSKPANSAAALENPTTATPTFVADAYGSYEMSLVVSDGYATSTADTVTINVQNGIPVADAGDDQLVKTFGEPAMLDGTASSDAEGSALSFQWSFVQMPEGSEVSLDDATIAQPSFTADVPGIYELSLVVNDGFDSSAADTVIVEVNAPVVPQKPAMGGTTSQEVIESMMAYVAFDLEMFKKHFEDARKNTKRNREANLLKRQTKLMGQLQKILDHLHMHRKSTRIMANTIKRFDGCAAEGKWNKGDLVGDCESQAELTAAMNLAIELRNSELDFDSRDMLVDLVTYIEGLGLENFTKIYKNERQNQKRNTEERRQIRKDKLLSVAQKFLDRVENHRPGAKLANRLGKHLPKRIDGCEATGASDRNDWVGACDVQAELNSRISAIRDSLNNQPRN